MILTQKIIKRYILPVLLSLPLWIQAQNFSSQNAKIAFYSSTPIEDIRAASTKANTVFISKTREIAFQIPIKSFEFERKLMQTHFNENYMESDKYPFAKFKGVVDPSIDLTKDGVYNVTAKGILSIHGVDKPRTISGKLSIKNGNIIIESAFNVACANHSIKIPTVVFTKIAEIIQVKVDAILTPLK